MTKIKKTVDVVCEFHASHPPIDELLGAHRDTSGSVLHLLRFFSAC